MVNFNYSVNPSVFELNTNNDNLFCGAIVYTSNTASISFSGEGTVCYPLSAQLNVSSQAGNIFTMLADGAYASGSTSVSGAYLFLTGGTLSGSLSGTSISATTFFGDGSHLTGISTVQIDARLTGASFNNNLLSLTNKSGNTVSTFVNNFTGLTINGTLSAATYLNLPASNNTFETGSTFTNNNLVLTNNSGGTISTVINNLTGLTVNGTVSVNGILTATSITLPQASITSTGVDVVIGSTAPATIRLLPLGSDIYLLNTQAGKVNLGNGANFSSIVVENASVNSFKSLAGKDSFYVDSSIFYGALGDVEGVSNGTKLIVDDSTQTIRHIGNTILSGNTNTLQLNGLTASTTDTNLLSIDGSGNVHKFLASLITGSTNTGTSISIDARLTGATFSNNILSLTNKSGVTVSTVINNFTGLTVNGIISASTISATTYFGNGANLTGLPPEIYTTGGTYNNNTLVYTNNTGGTVSTVINNFTGLTINGTLSAATISATTLFVNGVQITGNTGSANTASTFTTAATYNAIAGVLNLTRNDGVIYSATGWNYITATTLAGNVLTVKNNTGSTVNTTINAATGGTFSNGTITLAGTGTLSTITGLISANTFTSGVTFSSNTISINRNDGVKLTALVNNLTGLTVNGAISAVTVSAGTFFGSASGLTGIVASAAGSVNQLQYNNGSGALAANALFAVDVTNNRIAVSAASGNDIGFYAKNTGTGGSDTATVRLENSNSFATLFISTAANSVASSTGFFTSSSNGIVLYPQAVPAFRSNSTSSYFYENGSCKVGFAVTTPTAQIHIAAGGSAANTAPIKLNSGTVNTTPETGAIEYASTQLTFVRSGTTRETIVTTSATGATAPINTTTPVTWVNYVLNGITYKMPLYQ